VRVCVCVCVCVRVCVCVCLCECKYVCEFADPCTRIQIITCDNNHHLSFESCHFIFDRKININKQNKMSSIL
jgi:hypothetical protein